MSSRFHLSLTVFLAVAMGSLLTVSLMPQTAEGYPSLSAVSYGQNPVTSRGGSLNLPYGGEPSVNVITAPLDQDIVVTDLAFSIFSDGYGCSAEAWEVSIQGIDGLLAMYTVWAAHEQNKSTNYTFTENFTEGRNISMRSGLRIPAGSSATLIANQLKSGCSWRTAALKWTWSGYHAAQ